MWGIMALLIISFPIFYILGIVQLVSWLFRKNNSVKNFLEKLKIDSEKSPNKTLKEYYKELKSQSKFVTYESISDDESEEDIPVEDKIAKEIVQKDTQLQWNNWYNQNSINLLLYLGAFLIVAAASIFVGFQWDTLSGIVKAFILTFLTLSFFVSGLWFRSIPKIKTAGITFIGISALLIPICGTGWYNFVLKGIGVSAGAVWMVTSLISLALYAFLVQKFKNSFFTYTASLATISLALSFVNVAGLNKQLYILASLAGSFLLLLVGIFAKKEKADDKYIGIPLEVSANIVMPATLIYGLFTALQTDALFSFEASAGVLIASLFYLVAYLSNKYIYTLAISQFLLPAGIILLFGFLKIPHNYLLYTLDFIAVLYMYVAILMKKDTLKDESDTNLFSSAVLSILVFIMGYGYHVTTGEQFLFSLIPILAGIGISYIKKDIRFGYISSIFLVISTWILTIQIFHFNSHPQLLAHIFTSFGVAIFICSLQKKYSKNILNFCRTNTILFIACSVVIANINFTTQSITFAVCAILMLVLYIFENKKDSLYGMAILLNVSLLFLLPSYKIKAPFEYYPIYFSGLSLMFYFSSFLFKKESDSLRNIGLVNQIITTAGSVVIFGQNHSYYYGDANNNINKTTLSTGYILTLLSATDYFFRKKNNMDYLTSFFAVSTYIWQLMYLNISETLYYTIPVGIYLLSLGFLREAHHDDFENSKILNFVGTGMLILPTFFLAQSHEGYFYPTFVGIIGITLLVIGITAKNKIYQYSGAGGVVLAILPQTFQYLLLIPKWLIVGIVGFVFVIAAIFLLLKRDDKK